MSAAAVGLSLPGLVAALRKGARANGDWDRVAAIELLINHESWLQRTDFRRFIEVERDGSAWLYLTELALWVDKSRASSSATAILRLACSLVGATPNDDTDTRWTLHSILRPLDGTNAALVVEAVRYAALGPEPAAPGGAR